MDTSKEYIKMCEMATEIQKEYDEQSFYEWVACNNGIGIINECISKYRKLDYKSIIWLPRQDQLQDMLKSKNAFIGCWITKFSIYVNSRLNQSNLFTSYEKLWLAFVMKEKYNKTWDGKKWKKN